MHSEHLNLSPLMTQLLIWSWVFLCCGAAAVYKRWSKVRRAKRWGKWARGAGRPLPSFWSSDWINHPIRRKKQ